MIIYRDDHWPPRPLEPRGPEPPVSPEPTPEPSPPGGGEPGEPGFPGGGRAGGGFGPDDYGDPDPDPDFGDESPYDGRPDERDPDDGFRMSQRENRCIQARHELWRAYDQLDRDQRAIEARRATLEEAREHLRNCPTDRRLYVHVDGSGRWHEVTCEYYHRTIIARTERSIEMLRARQDRTRSRIPTLRRRVEESCVGP